MLVTALPATANNKPTTGTQINLISPPATFAANTPFYIEHGPACTFPNVSDCTNASSHFDLYVDSVLQPSTVDIDRLPGPPPLLVKRNLTNYPTGLPAGPHSFVGVFVVNGSTVLTLSTTITFT